IQMPSIWYQVGLHSDEFDVVGFSFAGMPGVIIGHNARIAWGLTNVGPDVQDLYVEKLNPQDPDQYEFQGEWVDMDLRYETIEVAGRDEPVVIKVRSTRHGPIINDVLHGPTSDWAYGWQPLALRWTALEPGSMATSILALDRAQNWYQFREALSMWDVPSQNMIYADVDGNIGYQMPGRIPIRAQGDGTMPAPGWSGEYEWEGWIPFEELPNTLNPPEGYIVTANNPVVDTSYPYFISRDWALGYRAQRIVDLLTEQETFSLTDMARIQMDSYDMSAAEVLPYLLELEPEEPELVEALERLGDWDLQMRRESTPAALYGAFWVLLMDDLLADDLGERPGGYGEKLVVRELVQQPDSLWWDDVGTPGEVETRD
ncbi:MAG: penicillin acylase family protein, partial [Anaerolineales bacterium]|nr:penicillin acylase family protein [Anaerolineales bacterium]